MTASSLNHSAVAFGAAKPRVRRLVAGTAIAAVALTGFVGLAGSASAAPGDSVDVSVEVGSVLDLVISTDDFELNGPAGATVDLTGAVAYTVTTNNNTGYSVTVEASADVLTGASTADGTDTIPVGAITVEQADSIVDGPQPIEGPTGDPVELHTQATRSLAAGDNFSNDYSIVIPFVTPDTYSVSLNYLATAAA